MPVWRESHWFASVLEFCAQNKNENKGVPRSSVVAQQLMNLTSIHEECSFDPWSCSVG